MFIGGCAGSTTCGMKVFRFQILYAMVVMQLRRLLEPHGVFFAYYNGKPISYGVGDSVMGFFFVYLICFVVLAFALLVLFWGSAFAVVKVGLDFSPPILFAGLRSLLREIGDDIRGTRLMAATRPHIHFDRSQGIHFARFTIIDDPDRGPAARRLLFASIHDGDLETHVKEIVRITPDMALPDLRPDDSAMLILPGADTWLTGGNAAFATKARQFVDAGVPVAAMCGATAGLAAEGLLDDRKHTSNAREFLAATGYRGTAQYCDDPAVTDAGVITASGLAPVEFAREVFAALGLYEPSVLASWYKLYGRRDPAGYVELMGVTA
jgi:putative intracellular protease/amidase